MFGGDEVSAVVVDVGSVNVKAGFAGDDSPQAVFPSCVGVQYTPAKEGVVGASAVAPSESEALPDGVKYERKVTMVGTNQLCVRKDGTSIESPLNKWGLVDDWDITEHLLHHTFKSMLHMDAREHPILMVEPNFNTRPLREKMTELMFEKYQAPAFFVAKSAMLSAFASCKATGLVLDSGAATTTLTPVYDGYVLQKGIVKSTLAGRRLEDEYLQLLRANGHTITPRYMVNKKEIGPSEFQVTVREYPQTTLSYHNYMTNQVVRDLKETVCRVSEVFFDAEQNASLPTVAYELPDGKVTEVGTDRFSIPELLFYPHTALPNSIKLPEEYTGLHQMVCDSITRCDVDIRKELYGSIIVTGGNTLFPGFVDRLHKEVTEISPVQKMKLIAVSSPMERRCSSWIGGSILATLGTFHQMWMSRQEYDEHGRSLVERKCP